MKSSGEWSGGERGLFSDAEFAEDAVEDVVAGDVAGDVAEGVECLADVEGQEFVFHFLVEGDLGALESLDGAVDGLEVSGAADEHAFGGGEFVADFGERVAEFGEAGVCGIGGVSAERSAEDVGSAGEKLFVVVGEVGGKIDFVDDDDQRAAGLEECFDFEAFFGGEALVLVDESDDEIGLFAERAAAFDADGFDLIAGRAQAGGVDEAKGDAAEVNFFFEEIAGRAGDVGDDGAVGAVQEVEKRGFSGVCGSENDGVDAFALATAFVEASAQAFKFVEDVFDALADFDGFDLVDVFFVAEVDGGFDQNCGLCDAFDERFDRSAELALQVIDGEFVGAGGGGIDEVGDGFGLGQVETSVQECALRELAWFGDSRAEK